MEKLIGDYKIAFTKGDTYAIAIKFKNIAEDLRLAYFTVKENPDDEPLIQKTLGAGIDKIDDRAYKNEKTYKLQIQAGDTAYLEPHVQYLYDLQVTVDNVVKTVLSGVFVLSQSVTGVSGATTATLEIAVDDTLDVEVSTTPATNGIEYEQDPVANAKIGDMTALSTTAKETLVGAINEAKNDATANAERVNKILNGTTTVPKATETEQATNYNTQNGTIKTKFAEIDERLQALGFSEGVAEYTLFNTSVSANSLTKKGKYVIFNFSGVNDIYDEGTPTITIPDGFRPKEQVVVLGSSKGYVGTLPYVYETQLPIDVTISPSGEVSFKTFTVNGSSVYESIDDLTIKNAGWETN